MRKGRDGIGVIRRWGTYVNVPGHLCGGNHDVTPREGCAAPTGERGHNPVTQVHWATEDDATAGWTGVPLVHDADTHALALPHARRDLYRVVHAGRHPVRDEAQRQVSG